ncbi:hypothetical protein JRQ81_011890 [Phrynocephalus forsythii]|uniref:Uncharacterized protein n=1 Tax=Phrynocephalus forsythii TaxID=171643 RepID=A0A9Q0X8P0_9SAUR|nr:hypothetical protein JRQ81_011890 [Phrynocephalus forsythii]
MSHLRIGIVALLASLIQITGRVLLPPPRHLRVLSKDFSLFLTWVPDESYPPGVSYTVQWKDPYDVHWEEVSHCRDISGRDCNITCVPTELHNRYWVQVRAQARSPSGMARSTWVPLKDIDYELSVEPAPPILQVHKTENSFVVKATFLYPSCTKDIFQHQISYNLEVWEAGTKNKMEYNELKAAVVEFNTTQWGSGNYCLHAQSYFPRNKKWSSFSPPLCTPWHKKGAALQREAEIWKVRMVLPILLVLPIGLLGIFWYKHKLKHPKMPQALDFTTFKCPKKLMEPMEVIAVDVLLCTGEPLEAGRKNRLPLPMHLTRSPRGSLSEEDDEDEEDEDDGGSPIPYRKMHPFMRKGRPLQTSSTDQKVVGPPSTSGNGQPQGGCLPEVMASGGPSLSTVRLTEGAASRSSESQWRSLSENSMDDPLEVLVTCPATRGEGQAESKIECLPLSPRLAGGIGSVSPTRWPFMAVRDHPEAPCGQPDISRLLEEQLRDLEGFEEDTSGGSHLVDEVPFLAVSYKERVEDMVQGEGGDAGLSSRSQFCGYEPKHVPYLSRMPVG